MAAVHHLGFWKLAVFIMWPLSTWRSASAHKISPKSDNRSMNYDQKSEFQDDGRRHLEFQKFHHVTVTRLNIWCSVPNFIKIGRFFTEIWQFNDFSKWRRSVMLDFKNLQFLSFSPCRPAVLLPRTKFRWNRTTGRWVMAKTANFKMAAAAILILKTSIFGHVTVTGFNIWCSVANFIKIGRFVTKIWRFNDFQNGGRPPSWILHICIFCPVALVSMPFCFLIQNFAEIWQWSTSYGQKIDFQDGGVEF